MLIINDGSLDIMLQSYNFKPKEGKELQILSCIHVMKDYANHNYFFFLSKCIYSYRKNILQDLDLFQPLPPIW